MSIRVKSSSVIIDYEEHVGDDLNILWNWTAPAANGIQIPVNLTGYSAKFSVKAEKEGVILLQLSTMANTIFLGEANNNIRMTISSANTTALGAGLYYYDFAVKDILGKINTMVEGKIKLLQDISDSW